MLDGSKRDHRGGDEMGAEIDLDAPVSQVYGSSLCEVPCHEAAVKAEHDFGMGVLGLEPLGGAFGEATEVIKGEVFGEDGAPAICAEADGLHGAKIRWAGAGAAAGAPTKSHAVPLHLC